jgi:hypothetical protein
MPKKKRSRGSPVKTQAMLNIELLETIVRYQHRVEEYRIELEHLIVCRDSRLQEAADRKIERAGNYRLVQKVSDAGKTYLHVEEIKKPEGGQA